MGGLQRSGDRSGHRRIQSSVTLFKLGHCGGWAPWRMVQIASKEQDDMQCWKPDGCLLRNTTLFSSITGFLCLGNWSAVSTGNNICAPSGSAILCLTNLETWTNGAAARSHVAQWWLPLHCLILQLKLLSRGFPPYPFNQHEAVLLRQTGIPTFLKLELSQLFQYF